MNSNAFDVACWPASWGIGVPTWMVPMVAFALLAAPSRAAEPVHQILTPGDAIPPGSSVLWSPTLQACWDGLKELHQVNAIDLKPANADATFLDRFQWDVDRCLPPRGVVVVAGVSGPDFVKTANQALEMHFGNSVPFLDPGAFPVTPSTGMAVLTHFKRSVRFAADFGRVTAPFAFHPSNGNPLPVEAFGSFSRRHRQSNVRAGRVLAYAPGAQIALALNTSDENEFVVLMQDPRQTTVAAAIDETRRLLAAEPLPMPLTYTTELDSIFVPRLEMGSLGAFEDRLGGTYQTPKTHPGIHWRIERALQRIDLSLDRGGADMQVRAFVIAPGFLASEGDATVPAKPEPREFRFDRPFYLMFWRKGGSYPYLVSFIDGGGLVPRID